MMVNQLPILPIMIPFVGALVCGIAGIWRWKVVYPFTVATLVAMFFASVGLLGEVIETGPLTYRLGGWQPPYGIELAVNTFTAAFIVLIALVGVFAVWAFPIRIRNFKTERSGQFYALVLLNIAGLTGLVITNDAFNLYVFLEVSALSSYALLAVGNKRAIVASLRYLILGSLGACLYLLGVGYLYILTGTLNMSNLYELISHLHGSPALLVSLIMIIVGLGIKMALFPLHGWLPRVYANSQPVVSTLLAPLATKVSVLVMMKMIIGVFSVEYVFDVLNWEGLFVSLASVAIIYGSVVALRQTDLRLIAAYVMVAEVGYMVGGLWLGNDSGITGSAFHLLSDVCMTLAFFLFVHTAHAALEGSRISDLAGLFRTQWLLVPVFICLAMAFIGIPPFCGFFSKWYLIKGAIHSGHVLFIVALLFSSLANAVIFFRIIETAYLDLPDRFPEPIPVRAMVPLYCVSGLLLVLGLGVGVTVNYLVLPGLAAF